MNTAYAFEPHLPLVMAHRQRTSESPTALFALVDFGQLKLSAKEARMFEVLTRRRLYEGHPEAVMALSPVLLPLQGEFEDLAEQIVMLDRLFAHLPISSLIQSHLDLDSLTEHLLLRSFIEADGDSYLLRLADSQMLKAAHHAFHPEQRGLFFSRISAWWVVNHHGHLENIASNFPASGALKLPLKLNASQTSSLLKAAEVPLLAAQLSHLDPSFEGDLSHSQRMVWLEAALREAGEQEITDETERLSWLAQAWEQKNMKSIPHS